MTNDEAIKDLKKLKSFHNGSYGTAIDLAIKALEQTELNSSYNGVKYELEPSEDCISRKEALGHRHIIYDDDGVGYSVVRVDEIEQLPSVTPQPNIGHWEYVQYDSNPNIGNWHCSECMGICTEMHSIEDAYNYCPNCGAKMEVIANE